MKIHVRTGIFLLLGVLLTGCAADRNLRYAGVVSGCGPDRQAELQINGDQVVFTPDEGTWTLRGRRNTDGGISATAVADANGQVRRPGSFSGHLTDGRVIGELVVPGCTARVDLSVVPNSLKHALPPRSPVEKLF